MKKLLTLGALLALSTSMTFAATSYTDAFKKAVKQDIEATKQEHKSYKEAVKDSIKKDIEAKKDENAKAQNAKKEAKLKEIDKKLTDLNKELDSIQNSKNITYTEKTLRTRSINKQIEFYQKQKDALK